ncbi:ABC multidrug transporter B [Cladobotryum mycophilum]|uniref:ABC multidrug transporter B n=1 Tax=Cladobotryum mycophilum TaxID=491253 RepID=A0ABR0SWR8_9HYPO
MSNIPFMQFATAAMEFDALAVNASADKSFGPQLPHKFDFTLLFEQTILSILPSTLLIVASPIYVYHLLRKPVCVRSGLLLWAKLAVAVALLGVDLANIALWSSSPDFRSQTSLAAASLSCINALCIIAMLCAEHRHSVKPSTLLSLYLSITILFDIAQARSYFSRNGLRAIGALSVVVAILKLVLVLLEEVPKKSLVRKHDLCSSLGREATSGFWSRSLFLWLNSTLLIGFRNIISVDTLEDMGPDFHSERLFAKFEPFWAKANRDSAHCLMKACLSTLIRPFLAIALPRLCYTGFKYAQPFLIQRIITAIGEPDLSRDTIGGLLGATALVYLGMAITHAYYSHLTYRMITMFRGVLVSAILKKTLGIEYSTAKESAAVTLMSTDIDGIEGGLAIMNDVWASIIELGLGIYILTMVVGGASFLVVMPVLVTTIASVEIARRMIPSRIAWNEKIQERVATTANILGQVKGIKMTGLAPVVSEHIQNLRVVEVKYSKQMRVLNVALHAMGNAPRTPCTTFSTGITPVVVIAGGLFWTKFSGHLTAAEAFGTLSIIALVSGPLVMLLVSLPLVMSITGCFGRIQKFLLLDENVDKRSIEQSSDLSDAGFSINGSADDQNWELRELAKPVTKGQSASDHNALELINASISVAEDADALLQNVNMKFAKSSLTMIVGPVGCGKSTLLKAMLGESKLKQGTIQIKHEVVAFCDQTSWLRNITIRDNIVSQGLYDAEWYDGVIRACLLHEDMQQLPEGDQTLAGSGGVNLSGGQKQRVALARAIYSRKPILVLDDVFSALDRRTSRAVFSRLLGLNGLLRKSGTTVIMVTHSLEHLSLADKVFVMDSSGVIHERDAREASSNEPLIQSTQNPDDIEILDKQQDSPSTSESASVSQAVKPSSVSEGNLEERQRGDVTLYSFYLKSIGVSLFCLWLCTVAVAAVADHMPQIYIRIWLERDPTNNRYFIGYAILGVTTFACASGMLAFYLLKIVPKSAEYLHQMLLDSVMSATLYFLASTDSGSLLNRFSQDMTLVSQVLPMHFVEVAYLGASILTDIGIIASGAKYAAAVIPFFAVVLYFLQKYYLRTSRQMRHLDLEAKSPLYTQFTEMSSGLQHIRAFGWQSSFTTQSLQLLDYSQKPYYYMFCIQRWLMLVLDMCVLLMAVVLVAFALNFRSTTSQSAIGLALVNIVTFSETLTALINGWIELETSLGAVARLRSFVEKTPVEEGPSDGQKLPLAQNWPHQGKIEFRSVSAKYNVTDEAAQLVLNDLTVTIQPGQKVGIIGRTGSGKSSFLLTVLHMLDYSGVVSIDDIDISQIPRQQLRSCITTLPQDPIELPGSIRNNLVPFGGATISEEAMTGALDHVGLLTHISTRGGLDAELASMGLSQGQKQLLCLARAVLHNASSGSRVVLIDEATSNMDNETDAKMQAVMSKAFAGCTVLVVAHRLETIQDADVVLELDAGRLVKMTDRNERL